MVQNGNIFIIKIFLNTLFESNNSAHSCSHKIGVIIVEFARLTFANALFLTLSTLLGTVAKGHGRKPYCFVPVSNSSEHSFAKNV